MPTTTPTPTTPAQRRRSRRAQTIRLIASLRHAWLACHEPETLRRQAAQRAAATRAAKREQELRAAVLGAYHACGYRTAGGRWAGGEHATTVRAADCPGASGGSARAWSRNGKWSGLNSSHALTVRADWRARVEARGLAVVADGRDRRLVLDCDEVRGPLAHVLAVLPSRGFDLRTEWRWVEVPAAQSVEVRS